MLTTPWQGGNVIVAPKPLTAKTAPEPRPSAGQPADLTGVMVQQAQAASLAKPISSDDPKGEQGDALHENAPPVVAAARAGRPDDLKKIIGVGPKLEKVLNDLGFWHFDQIAGWAPAEVVWVDARIPFKGRIERDDWVAQAIKLAKL